MTDLADELAAAAGAAATIPANGELPVRTGLAGLTLRELYDVERIAKCKVGALGDPKTLGARELAAIGWVIRRRADPGYTFEQALELTMAEVNELIAPPDPTSPGTSSG